MKYHYENKLMMTAAKYDQWEIDFLIEMEEEKELRIIFNAVQELMRDIAIALRTLE